MKESDVSRFLPFPGKPGVYQLRMASWLPKIKVSVFKHSVSCDNEWRIRCAGVVVDPGKVLGKSAWRGPLVSQG